MPGTVAPSRLLDHPRRSRLPWYWTDEIAATFDRLDNDVRESSHATLIGIRRAETTLEEAAMALEEDGNIHLMA